MVKYIAVDSGKFATKLAVYDKKKNKTSIFKFRTKTGAGSFDDDSLEKNTFIAEIDGVTYKIGNGAITEADLQTSKKSESHRLCTLSALAMCASCDEVDEMHVAIGIPVKEWEVVEKRNEYKNYILPDGEISVTMKTKSDEPPKTKRFKIVSKYVFPESVGALYLDRTMDYKDSTAAVIDIGNLNINCTCWNSFELDRQYSLTDELGGNILIAGLSQELSAQFSRCDENLVARVLTLPKEERKLCPVRPNPKTEEDSRKVIDNYLLEHVKTIKRRCDSKHWSLDFMNLVFIGGTSKLLKNEIYEVFGECVYIPDEPEYANVIGFLRLLGAKVLDEIIPFPEKKESTKAKENKEKSA